MSYLHVWKCCDVILFGGPILWHWWSCWWWRDVDRRSEGYAEDFCPVQLWPAAASRNTSCCCCCLAAFVVESPWGSGWIVMVAWPANRDNHLSKYKRIWTAQPVPRWQNGRRIKDNTIQLTTRITETGITNLTRITNEMAISSNYLKYFNRFLAILLE